MKDLGRLSSEELTAVFTRSCRTADEKNLIVEILKELRNESSALDTEYDYEKKAEKRRPKPKSRATKDRIVREVLTKMKLKLEEYENSDAIDEWSIYFNVGEDYSKIEMADIKESHSRLALCFYYKRMRIVNMVILNIYCRVTLQ